MTTPKKKNVIQKFREFWGDLDTEERADLWNLLSALRGPDNNDRKLKMCTTARLRSGILGNKLSVILHHVGWDVKHKPLTIKQCSERDEKLENQEHFKHHYLHAMQTLQKHCPKWQP